MAIFENIPPIYTYLFFTFLVAFLVGGSITMYYIMIRVRYPIRASILREVPPYGFVPDSNDRAREVAVGDGGEHIYYLRNLRRLRAGFGKFIGKNKIAWGIAQDGFWYNLTFGNLNKTLNELGVFPVSTDMRMANNAIRELMRKEYEKKDFFQKWGPTIMMSALMISIITFGVTAWVIFDKAGDTIAIANQGAVTNQELQKENLQLMQEILLGVNNIKQGSGFAQNG